MKKFTRPLGIGGAVLVLSALCVPVAATTSLSVDAPATLARPAATSAAGGVRQASSGTVYTVKPKGWLIILGYSFGHIVGGSLYNGPSGLFGTVFAKGSGGDSDHSWVEMTVTDGEITPTSLSGNFQFDVRNSRPADVTANGQLAGSDGQYGGGIQVPGHRPVQIRFLTIDPAN